MAVFREAAKAVAASTQKVSPIELMIEAEQIDHALFESLIEVDFAEVYSESGIIALTEEEKASADSAQKKGIITKLGELIKKAAEAIKAFFEKVYSFITELTTNSGKIKEKYGKVMEYAKLKDCPVTGSYVKTTTRVITNAKNILDKQISGGAENLDSNDNRFRANVVLNPAECIADSSETPIIQAMGAEGFADMKELVENNYKSLLSAAREAEKKANDGIKQNEKKYRDLIKKADSEAKAQETKEEYNKIVDDLKLLSKFASNYRAVVIKVCGVDRVNYLKMARWASKGKAEAAPAEGEKKEESVKAESAELREAFELLIEMENDAFIESIVETV